MARSDIDALNATFTQGVDKGDAGLIASVYAPDARIFPPGEDVQTGPAIQAYWQDAIDSGMSGGTLETVRLEEHGDVAIEEGRYEVRADGDLVDTGKYLVVYRRQPDGSWKNGLDIWNSSQAEAVTQ